MGAAPIRACHRRALRHPVPQAPERAFIVARARRKAFLWLRRGFFRSQALDLFCSVLEFGPVPTSPTPLLQGAPVRLLHPVGRASPRPVVWSVLLLPA